MEILYEYESNFYTNRHSEKIVCQGEKSFVQIFIAEKEFYDLFGGFILSENLETNNEFIGVWGRRKCQKFRRVLRERCAEFELIKDKIPDFRRIMTSVGQI